MKVIIRDNYEECSTWVAEHIKNAILNFAPTKSKPFTLGLPTGSTPIGVYKKLIEMCKNYELSFENVITFNMDEYIGLLPSNPQSYHYFMEENFFSQIDIKKENINILNGMAEDLDLECIRFEEKIKKYGGIRLFFGGVGTDGHIAFNEPYTSLNSRTHIQALNSSTIEDNSRFFSYKIELTPKKAITVGIGTILDADEVLIMATGTSKANAIQSAIEGSITQASTITSLQLHNNSIIVCDEDATNELKVKTVNYFKRLENIV